MQRIEYQRERAARQVEKGRDVAKARERALEREMTAFEVDDADPPPMPPEIRAVLDRISDEVAEEMRAARKKDKQK